MKTLTADTKIIIKRSRPALTGDTKIRLSQIKDLAAWVEDRTKYQIGDISKTTGLKKCFVNGNIVWLDPKQNNDFLQSKMTKKDTRRLAESAKPARSDGKLNNTGNPIKDARNYLNYMKTTWNKNPVQVRHLHNVFVTLNKKSSEHLFYSHGQRRPVSQIKERSECLPYVKDILSRSGKPADHTINNKGEESYTFVGNAVINNKKRNILVVISKDKGHYYYLSVFKIK